MQIPGPASCSRAFCNFGGRQAGPLLEINNRAILYGMMKAVASKCHLMITFAHSRLISCLKEENKF